MYLKTLEMLGFKSFADKTKLDFEPGLTSIVGPNGCGKSNVSDAIRWVIGEQSAKAMRAGKMEDVIFNGTDARKPLGMAEVSLTLADCDKSLGLEYDEITVTRRVFRSGEGEYLLNKTPCRLKDIQRLFMDTGVGTTSYSVMEQGRIDRVLSARPEDRRAVFEEASGITKFKADKKEALRKLEYTEANLLRLSDVIREVRRQIGSLQRQAGKARRYKELREELRKLDVFSTRQRLTSTDREISQLEADIASLAACFDAAHQEVADLDASNAAVRESLVQTEREIGSMLEAGSQAQSRLDHAREVIRVNDQRIEENRAWADRDAREIDVTRRQMEEKQQVVADLATQLQKAREELVSAEEELKVSSRRFAEHQQQIDTARLQIQRLREESVELESLTARLQNQSMELESRERSAVLQRERLSAEKSQLARVAASYERRQGETTGTLEQLRTETESHAVALKNFEVRRADLLQKLQRRQQTCAELQSQSAAKQAQIDMLAASEGAGEGLPGGARKLLDGANPLDIDSGAVLGALASHLDVEPGYAVALEAALRAWLDAVVVRDAATAKDLLRKIEDSRAGAARLVVAGTPAPAVPAGVDGVRLVEHVRCSAAASTLVDSLIGNVFVVDSSDQLPAPPPAGVVYVTRGGLLARGDGGMEFWMTESAASNPLSRRNLLNSIKEALRATADLVEQEKTALADLRKELDQVQAGIEETRAQLDQSARALAQKEGENQIVANEAREARSRLETVSWELDNLLAQTDAGATEKQALNLQKEEVRVQRERIAADINTQTRALQALEHRHSELQADVTEYRIRFAGLSQKVAHLTAQHDAMRLRLDELAQAVQGRAAGIQSYEASIAKLTEESRAARDQIGTLEAAVAQNTERVESLRRNRTQQAKELQAMEAALSQKRTAMDGLRDEKAGLEIRHAENKMRRQNQLDRVASEYGLTLDQLLAEPPPEWEGEPMSLDAAETAVAEIHTKIDAMGPVNLVAIEEYQELEERHSFLTKQEEDLINAKQQLMEMIRKINRTTTELFRSTFDQINTNFQVMFERLFNGGTAKLVLVNEEDVLECGIEIIARPPGKKLQNISLLSGGERTLTAVALLFSIYMIKPSPFCLLDELDAALDDTNIGRFVKVLQDFLGQSQFVVITHNRQTIAAASVIYGVTMPEKGVSRIMSMKFNDKHSVAAGR